MDHFEVGRVVDHGRGDERGTTGCDDPPPGGEQRDGEICPCHLRRDARERGAGHRRTAQQRATPGEHADAATTERRTEHPALEVSVVPTAGRVLGGIRRGGHCGRLHDGDVDGRQVGRQRAQYGRMWHVTGLEEQQRIGARQFGDAGQTVEIVGITPHVGRTELDRE